MLTLSTRYFIVGILMLCAAEVRTLIGFGGVWGYIIPGVAALGYSSRLHSKGK